MIFYAWVRSTFAGMGTDGDGLPIELWETQVSALTAEEANAKKWALMIDVDALGFEGDEGSTSGRILFGGPLPPGSNFEVPGDASDTSWVTQAQGSSSLPHSQYPDEGHETIDIEVNREWCDEKSVRGFIVEYDATAAMDYSDGSFAGDPYMWMYVNEWAYSIGMAAYNNAEGLGLSAFKVYAATATSKPPSTLLLRLTIDPESDSTRLESYYAHPLVAPWVAQWPELAAYPGNFSPLSFLFEPSAHAYFAMPITIDMIKFPPEGPPPGATLNDYLYLEAEMLPDFSPLSRDNYGIQDDGGGAASYYAILPTWEYDPDPRTERPTVREVRIFAIGEFDEPTEFWAGRIGTVEKL